MAVELEGDGIGTLWLRARDVPEEDIDDFEDVFGDWMELTPDNLRRAARSGLDLEPIRDEVLTENERATARRATAELLRVADYWRRQGGNHVDRALSASIAYQTALAEALVPILCPAAEAEVVAR